MSVVSSLLHICQSWLEAVVWNEAALTLLPLTVQHLSSQNCVLDLEANVMHFEP